MATFTVVDGEGTWLVCKAPLGIRDPFTGVRFDHGQRVKIEVSAYLQGQIDAGVLESCDDPEEALRKQQKVEAQAVKASKEVALAAQKEAAKMAADEAAKAEAERLAAEAAAKK